VHENKGREKWVKTERRRQRAEGRKQNQKRPFGAALEAQGRRNGLESRVHNSCYCIFLIILNICIVLAF
jgi:hypothetical protein